MSVARAPFLPSRYRFLLSAFGLYLLVLTSLRVVFWLVFRGTDEPALGKSL